MSEHDTLFEEENEEENEEFLETIGELEAIEEELADIPLGNYVVITYNGGQTPMITDGTKPISQLMLENSITSVGQVDYYIDGTLVTADDVPQPGSTVQTVGVVKAG